MPHDIFISYSRKDSEHALSLAEKLRAESIGVWIDQQGIVGAEKWATEIVEGIKGCSTFILLISPDSVASENVLRELSLANESRKRILPVEIKRIELPSSFMYPLAGLQRVKIADFEGIIRAHQHGVERVAQTDMRKSLMILPFNDLSPTADNQWFADGIVSEMISSLSNIRALRLTDAQTTKDYKMYSGLLSVYAREMGIRYFVQGDVRKFGDQIKINLSLLDIENGEHLWHETYRGIFEDIFLIQETVAEKVLNGLSLTITKPELSLLVQHETASAEAYEYFLKAFEYFELQTKEGFLFSIQMCSEAISLDRQYARCMTLKAHALTVIFTKYDRNPEFLIEAEYLVTEALRINPTLWKAYTPLANVYVLQGKIAEAEELLKRYVEFAPDDYLSHLSLANFYYSRGEYATAIKPFEECIGLNPGRLANLYAVVINYYQAEEYEKCFSLALRTIPKFEKYLKLRPDDASHLFYYAYLLFCARKPEEARAVANGLQGVKDAQTLHSLAILLCKLGQPLEGLRTFESALDCGFKDLAVISVFLEWDAFNDLVETTEYRKIQTKVHKIVREFGLKEKELS